MKKYAIDLDNTVFDWTTPFIEFMKSKGYMVEARHLESYNLARAITGDTENFQRFYNEFHKKTQYKDFELYKGAVESVNYLNKHGGAFLMTRREADYRLQTELELLKHHVDYKALMIDIILPKPALCKYLGINTLIDDKPGTVIDAAKEGIKVYCIYHPWNKSLLQLLDHDEPYVKNIIMVEDWDEIIKRELR